MTILLRSGISEQGNPLKDNRITEEQIIWILHDAEASISMVDIHPSASANGSRVNARKLSSAVWV